MGKLPFIFVVLCLIKVVICADTIPNQNEKRGDSSNVEVLKKQYPEQASADATALHDAIVGLGTNDDKVVEIVTHRTNEERQLIRKAYTDLFHSDLIADLKGDLSGHYKSIVTALMLTPDVFAAKQLHKYLASISAVASIFNNYVEEMLCTKPDEELQMIKETYQKVYNTSLLLDMDILEDDNNTQFLKAIVKGGRNTGGIDTNKAKNQLKLFPEGPGNCSADTINNLMPFFANENFDQIQYVIGLYELNSNHTKEIERDLHYWCPDSRLLHTFLIVVQYAKNPISFYAEELFNSMIGIGTKDDKLIRIVVGRSEIDLYDIKNEYEKLFNRTLVSSVEADTSGYYKTILIKLIERAQPKPQIDVRSGKF